LIRSFDGKTPRIAESAFISEASYVVGDVEIGDDSNVWPGAVIRGDFAPIRIGKCVAIEDNCTVHTGHDLEIGDWVTIGHNAVVHCRKVGTGTVIGMNACILENAEIGDFCIVGAGSVVTEGMIVPDKSVVIGAPAKIKGTVGDQLAMWQEWDPDSYPRLARKYKEAGL